VYQDPHELFAGMRLLGEGGQGRVYCARKKDGVHLALKCIRLGQYDGQEEHVLAEANALRTMRHSCILKMFRTYRTADEFWISTEFMDCGSLAGILCRLSRNGEKLREHIVAYILRQVLRGLAFTHGKGRIHRDVKADNVLMNKNGDVKIGDFGVCAELTVKGNKRRTVVGTRGFMAPELERGMPYTAKVDVWSFGVLALECAQYDHVHSGRSDCSDENDDALRDLNNLAVGQVQVPVLKDRRKWSVVMNRFISACLTVNPAIRPTAAKLLKHDFFLQVRNVASKEELSRILKHLK